MEEKQEPTKKSWKFLKLFENAQLLFSSFVNLLKWGSTASLSTKVSIIALLLSIIAFFRDCSQENKIQKAQYALAQNEHRPIIEVADLKIEEIKMIIKDSSYRINNLEEFLAIDTNVIQDIKGNLEFSAKLFLTNTGNSRAKLYSEFYSDTTSGDFYLKQILEQSPKRKLSLNFIPDYYLTSEVNPGDTVVQDRYFKIQQVQDKTFTLHILVFYENELNHFFDTYYWSRFKVGEVNMRRRLIPEENVIVTEALVEDLRQMIKLVDENTSSSIYDKSQAKKMRKTLRQLMNEN